MISHIHISENEITIFLAPVRKLSSLIFTFFIFRSPHLIGYHLLGLLPPKSLPSLATTVEFHSFSFSCAFQEDEADTVISGSQMRKLKHRYSHNVLKVSTAKLWNVKLLFKLVVLNSLNTEITFVSCQKIQDLPPLVQFYQRVLFKGKTFSIK